MEPQTSIQPIALYLVEHHPLQDPSSEQGFRWIGEGEELYRDLADLIGHHSKDEITVLVDDRPAGPAWERLLAGLLEHKVSTVVTHLAPLSPAQRQQLIGICDQTGAQLITPADAGRNREAS